MGRPHMRDVLGNHLKDRSFRLVHWLSITLWLRRTSQESINLERKSDLDCSSDTRGEFGRVTYWLQTLRNWKRWTHLKSTRKDSIQNRWYFPKKKENLFFQSQMDESNPFGGDQDLRTSTMVRDHPIRGESHIDFRRESEGSLPPPHDSFPDAGEANNDFWSMSGNFTNRHHVEPRVQLYSPREESFPFPLKYIDVSRTAHTNLDVEQEKRIDDYWNDDGSRDLSDHWTGFTQFTLLSEKPPDGYMWSGVIQAWSIMARTLEVNGEAYQAEGEAKVVTWKAPILITHENCGRSISLTRRTRNLRRPSRMLVRNWKHQWLLLCPAKIIKSNKNCVSGTSNKINKTKISRGPGHSFGTYWQDTEWFKSFSGCWINSQWKFQRYQSTSVIPTSSNSWRNAKPFHRNAEPQREGRLAFGTHMVNRETFLQIQMRHLQHVIRRNWIHRVPVPKSASFMANTRSRSEMTVWTVSQKISHLQWRRLFKELWGRPTMTADFRSSLWQIP